MARELTLLGLLRQTFEGKRLRIVWRGRTIPDIEGVCTRVDAADEWFEFYFGERQYRIQPNDDVTIEIDD